jgi:hypothetical protein
MPSLSGLQPRCVSKTRKSRLIFQRVRYAAPAPHDRLDPTRHPPIAALSNPIGGRDHAARRRAERRRRSD